MCKDLSYDIKHDMDPASRLRKCSSPFASEVMLARSAALVKGKHREMQLGHASIRRHSYSEGSSYTRQPSSATPSPARSRLEVSRVHLDKKIPPIILERVEQPSQAFFRLRCLRASSRQLLVMKTSRARLCLDARLYARPGCPWPDGCSIEKLQ